PPRCAVKSSSVPRSPPPPGPRPSRAASTRSWGPRSSIPPRRGRVTGERVILGLSILVMVCSVLLLMLVLLHKGKGGGLSDLFGGGVTSSLGGSSVVERNLDRLTVVTALVWIVAVVVLGLLINRGA